MTSDPLMPTTQQTAVIELIEDIAVWLETCAVGGRLGQRIRMADQLRTGTWRSMPPRRGAPGDVARARTARIALAPPAGAWSSGGGPGVVDLNDHDRTDEGETPCPSTPSRTSRASW